MRTPSEMTDKIKLVADKLSENEILKKIDSIVADLRDFYTDDGNILSVKCVELSMLMVNLGEMVADYTSNANTKYIFRKFRLAQEYKILRQDINNKVKDSELTALENTTKEYEDEIVAQYIADILKTKYDDVDRIIRVVQSRVSYLKSEQKNLNLGN